MRNQNWGTPTDILARFEGYWDPCPYPRPQWDALVRAWEGNCFVNPPFNKLYYFVRKAVEEIERDPNRKIVLLMPTDRCFLKYTQKMLRMCDFEVIGHIMKFRALDGQTESVGYKVPICLIHLPGTGKFIVS